MSDPEPVQRSMGRPALSDPARWREIVRRLEGRSALSLEESEALVEAQFRLAVQPDTPLLDAIEMLSQCVRRDGGNPKFSYHLARSYLIGGRLDEAAKWLAISCRLSPTSHRIWTHVCVLQWLLNEKYSDPERYAVDTLRNRARAIADRILDRKEPQGDELIDFAPRESLAARERRERLHGRDGSPPASSDAVAGDDAGGEEEEPASARSATRRYLNSDELRWTGIRDVVVEQHLEGEARQGVVEALAPVLETIAEDARRRRGGLAGFAIVATQWIVSGYPTATIRRLLEGLELSEAERRLPAASLLDSVCEIYEADGAAAADLLAKAAAEGEIPEFLAALIHSRKILWKQLRFSGTAAYRQSRRCLVDLSRNLSAETEAALTETAAELSRRVRRSTARLYPKALRGLNDVVSRRQHREAMDPVSLIETLTWLEESAGRLNQIRQATLRSLDRVLSGGEGAGDPAQEVADNEARASVLEGIQRACESCRQQLRQVGDSVAALKRDDLPRDIGERLEAGKRLLDEASSLGPLARKLKNARARVASEAEASARTASEALTVHLNALAEIGRGVPDRSDASSSSFAEQLQRLERIVGLLSAAKQAASEHLGLVILPAATDATPSSTQQARADLDEVRKILALVASSREDVGRETEVLSESLRTLERTEAPPDTSRRMDDLRAQTAGLSTTGAAQRNIQRAESRLSAAPEDLGGAVSDEVLANVRRTAEEALDALDSRSSGEEILDGDTPGASAEETPSGEASGRTLDATPGSELKRTLAEADRAVDSLFDEAAASFEKLPPGLTEAPSMRDVMAAVQDRRAELLFRLGRRVEARRVWSRILRDDPFDLAALKNIAVHDTLTTEPSMAMESWRLYAERLYAMAAIARDVRSLVRDRVRLHGSFSRAYAARFLAEKLDGEWDQKIDADAALAFIANGPRVESFVDHVLLEFLNHHLAYRSNALVLGLSRDDSDEARRNSVDVLTSFLAEASRGLPHSGAGFAELAGDTFRGAEEELNRKDSTVAARESEVSAYAEEHDRHLSLLNEAARTKVKLYRMVLANQEFVTRMVSIDFLDEFRRLDEIPLNLSSRFSIPVAASLGMQPEMLQSLMKELARNLCRALLMFLLQESESKELSRRQEDQYRRLVDRWVHKPAFRDLLGLLDNPGANRLYPTWVLEWISGIGEPGFERNLVDTLHRYHQRYPGITGIARDLARLLVDQGKRTEAAEVLDAATRDGCHEDGRKLCGHFALQIKSAVASEQGDYRTAIEHTAVLVEEDYQNAAWIGNLIVLHVNLSSHGHEDPGLDTLSETVESWEKRAREFMDSWQPTDVCPIDEETLTQVRERLAAADIQIRYHIAVGSYNAGIEAGRSGSAETMGEHLDEATKGAEYVIEHASTEEHEAVVEGARELLEAIRKTASHDVASEE